ncbi:nuclear transport factor 2 family protein [Pseudarthrobacter sp. NS4]|uniref:nuclear transport factor 2 family protein n=1 Tax=Pseudarthrobacter sp. NS4 TaxID=2973976 RepID=UPI0037C5C062
MLTQDVLDAALERADALKRRDGESLGRLLHPKFCWISHKGDQFDRDAYLRSNLEGQNTWHSQILEQPSITMFDTTAVLTCIVTDDVSTTAGRSRYRMPMTQVWIHESGRWLLAAGHAGPRL